MTAVKVVDASALAALLFGEPEAEVVAGALDGARLVAPSLLGFELANVCLTNVGAIPICAKRSLPRFDYVIGLESRKPQSITGMSFNSLSSPA